MKKTIFLVVLFILLSSFLLSQIKEISPKEAFEMLKNPSTYLIDVRSVAEYVFVGHPEMAYNIPIRFWSYMEQSLVRNKNFLEDIKSHFKKKDNLIFICRSGGRSMQAAEIVKNAGFKNVFNLETGFEGEKNEKGLRTVNGWKNQLPYTYESKKGLKYKLLY